MNTTVIGETTFFHHDSHRGYVLIEDEDENAVRVPMADLVAFVERYQQVEKESEEAR